MSIEEGPALDRTIEFASTVRAHHSAALDQENSVKKTIREQEGLLIVEGANVKRTGDLFREALGLVLRQASVEYEDPVLNAPTAAGALLRAMGYESLADQASSGIAEINQSAKEHLTPLLVRERGGADSFWVLDGTQNRAAGTISPFTVRLDSDTPRGPVLHAESNRAEGVATGIVLGRPGRMERPYLIRGTQMTAPLDTVVFETSPDELLNNRDRSEGNTYVLSGVEGIRSYLIARDKDQSLGRDVALDILGVCEGAPLKGRPEESLKQGLQGLAKNGVIFRYNFMGDMDSMRTHPLLVGAMYPRILGETIGGILQGMDDQCDFHHLFKTNLTENPATFKYWLQQQCYRSEIRDSVAAVLVLNYGFNEQATSEVTNWIYRQHVAGLVAGVLGNRIQSMRSETGMFEIGRKRSLRKAKTALKRHFQEEKFLD